MLVGQIHPVCAHPTHIHLVWPTTAKVHQLVALGKHQCRCRVASVLRCTTREEGCRYIESRARCCDCSSAPQKDSCHPYLDQTISSLRHLQSLESISRFFSTVTHQQGVSTSRLSYGLLCAIATTWHALCF